MFLKFILFGILTNYLNVVQGLNCDVDEDMKNSTMAYKIARQHLFVGDFIEVSLLNLRIPEESLSTPPLVMMSIMVDKTLGYDIDHIFPYFTEPKERYYSLDLNKAANNEEFIDTPSTVAYKFDFVSKTLRSISPSLMVNLHPSISSIQSTKNLNQTEQIIDLISSKVDGYIFYNLSFALYIDAPESEGLYKLWLYAYEHLQTEFKSHISVSSKEVAIINSILLLVYAVIFSCTALLDLLALRNISHRSKEHLSFELLRIYKYMWPIVKLSEYWHGYEKVVGAGKMTPFHENVPLNINGSLSESSPDIQSIYYVIESDLVYHDTIATLYSDISRWLSIIVYVTYITKIMITVSNRALGRFTGFYRILNTFVCLMLIHTIHRVYDSLYILDSMRMWSYLVLIAMSTESLTNQKSIESLIINLSYRKDLKSFHHLDKQFNQLCCSSYACAQSCLHIIFVVMVSFNLVLASMIWFDVAFYFYWIQIAVEESIQILLWIILIRPYFASENIIIESLKLLENEDAGNDIQLEV